MDQLQTRLAHKSHIIWDWNGTLLDDVEIAVEVISSILCEENLPPITVDNYKATFCFPIVEYYRRLGFDMVRTPFEILADRFIQSYTARVPECALHAGATQLLARLRNEEKTLSVLSAAQETHLLHQLEHFGIRHFFDHVYGLSNHHAVSKIERGQELIAQVELPLEETILVGDTDHDLEVGQALGIDVLLLADGHQAYSRLQALHPHVIENRTTL